MPFPEMEEKRRGDPEAYGICFCFYNEEGTPGIPEFCVFNKIYSPPKSFKTVKTNLSV